MKASTACGARKIPAIPPRASKPDEKNDTYRLYKKKIAVIAINRTEDTVLYSKNILESYV